MRNSAVRSTVTKAHSVSRKNGNKGAGTSSVARRVAAIATVVVLGGVVGLFGPGSATAAAPVTTFAQLSDAFAAGGTVVLGDDITGGSALNVGAGKTVTLDLDGHDLSVSGGGGAAIGVLPGTTLIIVDASGDGTVTAGGSIGNGSTGANGVNPTPSGPAGTVGAGGAAGTVTGGNGLPGSPGNPGGSGGFGGSAAGTAPVVTGGDGATGGNGTPGANGGSGGFGGAASTTGTGASATGGNGADGGNGGTGATTGGAGGAGGPGTSVTGVGTGGTGGTGGSGGIGAAGQAGGDMGVLTILGGTVTATGRIGGGDGGDGDSGGNGGVGGAGGPGTGAGGTGVGGRGGLGGSGATGGAGGAGGGAGTITIAGATVNATIGCGRTGSAGAGGTAGANGADGASSLTAHRTRPRVHHGARGADGADRAAPCSPVAYGPQAPTAVSARAGHASAQISFTAPGDTGSSPITGYTVTATDTTASIRGGQQASGATSPITVPGLTAGDVYTFTVKATNDAGDGFASAPSSAVTAEDVATSTSLAGSGSPSATGESVTFTATVAPAPDGGDVAFEVDGTPLTGCTANAVHAGDGQAMCETSSLPAGTHSVVAVYGGDEFSAGSESAPLAQSVVGPDAPPGPTPPPALTPPTALTPPSALTPFPSDPVIRAGLEAVSRTTRTSRALSFTQGIVTKGKISWRLDLSFYLPKKKSDRRAARRKPIRLAAGGPTAAAPDTIRRTIRLGTRARAAIKRYPRARLVLRTTLRLPSGRAIHATKTLPRSGR